jgi:aldehyde dehydrogenase (NAD+)
MKPPATALGLVTEVDSLLNRFGAPPDRYHDGSLSARSPISGEIIGGTSEASVAAVGSAISNARTAYLAWRNTPAPKRGELVRLFAEELRKHELGRLISIEVGKILSEGLGEVQEMIDLCDLRSACHANSTD